MGARKTPPTDTPLFELPEPGRRFDVAFAIPLESIEEAAGKNPRADFGEQDGTFAALVESIRTHGLLQPPLLRPTRLSPGGLSAAAYAPVTGNRRLAALRALKITELPCALVVDLSADLPEDPTERDRMEAEVLAAYSERQQLLDSIVENEHRRPLTPMEQARAAQRLTLLGMDQAAIGKAFGGRSQEWTSRLLSLLELDPSVASLLSLGALSFSHGVELARLKGFPGPSVLALAQKAAGEDAPQSPGLSTAALRGLVDAMLYQQRAEATRSQPALPLSSPEPAQPPKDATSHKEKEPARGEGKQEGVNPGYTREQARREFEESGGPLAARTPTDALDRARSQATDQEEPASPSLADETWLVWAEHTYGDVFTALRRLKELEESAFFPSALTLDILAAARVEGTSDEHRLEDILAGWARGNGIDVRALLAARKPVPGVRPARSLSQAQREREALDQEKARKRRAARQARHSARKHQSRQRTQVLRRLTLRERLTEAEIEPYREDLYIYERWQAVENGAAGRHPTWDLPVAFAMGVLFGKVQRAITVWCLPTYLGSPHLEIFCNPGTGPSATGYHSHFPSTEEIARYHGPMECARMLTEALLTERFGVNDTGKPSSHKRGEARR